MSRSWQNLVCVLSNELEKILAWLHNVLACVADKLKSPKRGCSVTAFCTNCVPINTGDDVMYGNHVTQAGTNCTEQKHGAVYIFLGCSFGSFLPWVWCPVRRNRGTENWWPSGPGCAGFCHERVQRHAKQLVPLDGNENQRCNGAGENRAKLFGFFQFRWKQKVDISL